jgi:predicted phage baseplate assembly protein
MPLADRMPVLDDRRFDDLVAEARTRIPRYTPEWTDFNPGDAGFALVELFAWMTELLTYRMSQVPALTYLKFLELIGIELAPALPATTVLLFPVQPAFAGAYVQVPARAQVSAAPTDDGPPVVFETERPLQALKAQLEAVQVFDGYAYADVTQDNAPAEDDTAATGFQPFGRLAEADAALLLGFTGDAPIPPGAEIALAVWPATGRQAPPPAPCGKEPTAQYAPATLAWEYWSGKEWRPLKLLRDDTLAFTRMGFVLLKAPPKNELVADKIGQRLDRKRQWLRARIVRSFYETPPALAAVRVNAVAAIAAETVEDEVLGGSDGTPNQIFVLGSAPVLDRTLRLEIDEGQGFMPWLEVTDFFGSGPDDPHYVLNRSTGEVRLGDGHRARIPVANLDRPTSNVVARFYRFGGSARSNVAAGAVKTPMTGLVGIDTGKVANPFAAEGGTDEESLEAAKARAPHALKSRDRAVTAEDFELLAKQAGPIGRAKAVPLMHPNFPGMDVPGVVTVIVVPDVPGPTPTPSPGLLRTVCAHLDLRRLVTTELFVIGPTYVPVSIATTLVADQDADVIAVKEQAEAALIAFLHPLTGGIDGSGWPFGGTIYFSDLYRRATVPGVRRVAELTITLDGRDLPACTDAAIPAAALLAVVGVDAQIDVEDLALETV